MLIGTASAGLSDDESMSADHTTLASCQVLVCGKGYGLARRC